MCDAESKPFSSLANAARLFKNYEAKRRRNKISNIYSQKSGELRQVPLRV
jgi:hypothetical protein